MFRVGLVLLALLLLLGISVDGAEAGVPRLVVCEMFGATW